MSFGFPYTLPSMIMEPDSGVLGPEGQVSCETGGRVKTHLGPPVVPFCPFFGGEGSPTKIDDRERKKRKNGYPYSNLSTGGPSAVGLSTARDPIYSGRPGSTSQLSDRPGYFESLVTEVG